MLLLHLACLRYLIGLKKKNLNGQWVDKGGMDGAGGEKRGASQPDTEEAGKQDAQYMDEVIKPQGNT